MKLEVVRRPNSFPRIELKAVRGIEIHVYIDTLYVHVYMYQVERYIRIYAYQLGTL